MKKYHFGSSEPKTCEICGKEGVNSQIDHKGNLRHVCLLEDCNKRLYSKIEKEKKLDSEN